MTNNNPYNLIPLQPMGRNETDSSNTYSPEDMIKIYEQQFLTPVPEEKLTEFLPFLKSFYDIDNNTLDICAVVFEAIADFCIIYNHKIKVGDYEILGYLVREELAEDDDEDNESSEETPAYTLECTRNFFINDVEIPYQFNLFIHGDSYSTLTRKESLLEKMYWFTSGELEEILLDNAQDNASLASINEQLTGLGIREMDMTTIHEVIGYIEDSIIDDDMIDALNKLLDAEE